MVGKSSLPVSWNTGPGVPPALSGPSLMRLRLRVEPDVGSRARADRADVEHRDVHVHLLERRLAIDRQDPGGDRAGVEARATDVGADDVARSLITCDR